VLGEPRRTACDRDCGWTRIVATVDDTRAPRIRPRRQCERTRETADDDHRSAPAPSSAAGRRGRRRRRGDPSAAARRRERRAEGSAAAEPARLQARLERKLERLLRTHPTFPGAALAVRTPRREWTAAAGVANRTSRRPLRPDARFRVASLTKTFTAAATLRLAECGELALDDPIARRLGPTSAALLRADGYDVEAITVSHLLQHTSGLAGDYAELPAYPDLDAALPDPEHERQLALARCLPVAPSPRGRTASGFPRRPTK
jgi:CubicO group peptidase (beta-lactamase class C family)